MTGAQEAERADAGFPVSSRDADSKKVEAFQNILYEILRKYLLRESIAMPAREGGQNSGLMNVCAGEQYMFEIAIPKELTESPLQAF